jgi:CubicO group peptidase (beta-lactamase class C family)
MLRRPRSYAPLAAAFFALLASAAVSPTAAQRTADARQAGTQRDPIAGLDAYIQQAMRDWQGAALSIAIVKDDSIVFAKGYGVREVGKPDAATPRTLYAIGSNTKLFTAVAAGMMVDEGKLKWDAPITTYLPGFQLYDPFVTREITIADMLSHKSGLGRRGDLIWYGSPFDRAEILRRIRYLPPNSSFRSQYGYQNIMVMGAGEAVAAVAGRSWDDVIKQRIFAPLGMTSSNTSTNDLRSAADVATPHVWRNGKPVPVPWRNIDNIAPAGSINSSVLDMSQWLRFLLADGKFGGQQLIKASTLAEIESPQTITPMTYPDTLHPSTHFSAYGLGVGMRDYLGVKLLTHTGGIDGMLSQVTWVPERKLGVVILTNTAGHNDLYGALVYRVLDAYLGAPARDWSAIHLARVRAQEGREAMLLAKLAASRDSTSKPTLPLPRYAGTYINGMYPDFVVSYENGTLSARFGPSFSGPLAHWQYDTFRVQMATLGTDSELATFSLDAKGTPVRVDVQGIGEFTRKATDQQSASRP